MDNDDVITAGVAHADITPDNGRTFQGYVRPDIKARGVAHRLQAHVVVLGRDESKVAIVSADLLFGFEKADLLKHIEHLGYTHDNLLYAGTHTHSAKFAGDWTLSQIANAIQEADENRVPAKMGWSTTSVDDVNQSRSLEAHLANHGHELSPGEATPDMDPDGENHPRNMDLEVLRIDDLNDEPIAVISSFSVHPTSYTPHNTLYSADLVGAARCHLANSFDSNQAPLMVFLNGTQGDMISRYDDYNQFAAANTLGQRLSAGILDAWNEAGGNLTRNPEIRSKSATARYKGQQVEPGKKVGRIALFGLPFLGGAKNGPSFFYRLGLEGRKRPGFLSGKVHGRKLVTMPAPWSSEVEVQCMRLGGKLLLTVPGEPTVEMGRRVIEDSLEEYSGEPDDAFIVGLANGYHGYFTTPEEYDRQHYEGGHTVFGKHTEALIRRSHAELVTELDQPGQSQDGVSENEESDRQGVVEAPVGKESDAELVEFPSSVERYEVAEVKWRGEGNGRDRPIGEAFVYLERQEGDEWVEVASDMDLGFIWFVRDSFYIARYDIPGDMASGRYRFRINGSGYELTSDPFDVTHSSKLRVLGAEAIDDGVSFRVQNPAPDPSRNLRPRNRQPNAGTLSFEMDDDSYTANWDEDREAWICDSVSVALEDEITVPIEGFRDSHGNMNDEVFRLEIGVIDEVDWPSDMDTGGGKPPGPFGYGTPTVPR